MALAAEPIRLAGAEAILARPGGRHFAHQEQSYVARSRYDEQIKRYLHLFSSDQVLMLRSELMFENPSKICRLITDFLKVDPHPQPNALPWLAGMNSFSMSADTRKLLQEALLKTYTLMASRYGMAWG